jgi:hypothetical protein
MKPGFFKVQGGIRRPFIEAVLFFPLIGQHSIPIAFLIDTGADRTVLSPNEGRRLRQDYGLDLLSLPTGSPSRGVGGQMGTRLIEATLTIDDFSKELMVPIFEPSPSVPFPDWMPSLMGRDIIYEFGLHVSDRRNRVLFLDAGEEEGLNLP